MQKKFLSNLILVLVLNVLIKPFYILGVDAEFLKRIEAANPGEYGEYFAIIGLTFIFNIFLDLGISNYNTRSVAQDKSVVQTHFSSILSLRMLLVFGYVFLLAISGYFLGYSTHQFELLALLGFNQVLVSFILYFRSNISGLMLFKTDSIIGVLDRTLLVLMCVLVLWSGWYQEALSIELFVLLQTAAYGITALISGWIVFQKSKSFHFKWNPAFFKEILKKSLPYALLILLMTFYYRVDSVMLEQMLPNGKRETALYAQGFRFFEAFSMLGYLFAGLLLPIFSAMLAKKENVSDLTNMSFKLIFAIATTISIAMLMNSEDIMQWRFENTAIDLQTAATSFRYLMICFIAMATTYIYGTLLTANGSLKFLNYVAVGGVVLNFSLNLYLIPEYGAIGAAKASAITQVLTAVAQIGIAYAILHLKTPIRSVIEVIIFITSISCIAYFTSELDFINKLLSLISSGVILAFLLRLVDLKEGLKLLRK